MAEKEYHTKNSWEERQEARKQRYLDRADNARTESSRRHGAAREISSFIPYGQPILVGHHSEKRHRRDLDRIDTNMRKAVEESAKAEHYERKAAGVGKAGISSDDPDALVKLREKLAGLKENHEKMKAINAAWRKAKKPAPDDIEAWTKVAEILGVTLEKLSPTRANMASDFMIRAPYTYAITNNGGNMKRLEGRILQLERQANDVTTEKVVGEVRIVDNVEENRVQIFFPGKPSAEIRRQLKMYGFRWARYNEAWQRHRSGTAEHWAGVILAEYGKGVS